MKLDGEPLAGDELDVPAAGSTAGCSRWASAGSGDCGLLEKFARAGPVRRYTARSPHELVLGLLRGALCHARRRIERSPRPEGAAVFENSTACATRAFEVQVASRFDLPHAACRGAEGLTEPEPVESGTGTVYFSRPSSTEIDSFP